MSMKFYELDLTKLIPYGVPINSSDNVEYKNYINEFFLKGFESYFSQLFTVDNDALIRDYSRSCAGPTSLEACRYCTDDQLRDFIAEAGFPYYSGNQHDVNAAFLHALYSIPLGTPEWLTAITRYVANTPDVEATPIYHDNFTYDVVISGDITGSVNSKAILERITDNLGALGTAHTKVSGFTLEDTGSNVGAYAAVSLSDVNITFNTRVFGQDNLEEPLMLLALDDNAAVKLERVGGITNTYLMSSDGINWTPMTYFTSYAMLKGEARYFKSSGTGTAATASLAPRFALTGRFEAYNNIVSMSVSKNELAVPRLFENCTTLLRAPSLSVAKAIARNGCYKLFAGCTSLTKAPELPLMQQLKLGCYREMFYGCTSLTKAPYLPAGLVPEQGYYQMFYGCSNLSEIHCDAFEISAANCVTNWVTGVSSTGDFYGNPNTDWSTGNSGIPSGWTFHTNDVIIGETTRAPAGTTSLLSEYWWMYGFDNVDDENNLYEPAHYASVVNNMANYAGRDDIEFSDAIYWNGSQTVNLLDVTLIKLAMYDNRPEIYTQDRVITMDDSLNSGVIVKPGTLPTWTSSTIWALPSDLYSINNGTITWNTGHILYNAFHGLKCYKG